MSKKLVVGSVSFGCNSSEYHDLQAEMNYRMERYREKLMGEKDCVLGLDHVLDFIRELKISEQAGWEAFHRVDEELTKLKESLNGKEILRKDRCGNSKVGKKVCKGQ